MNFKEQYKKANDEIAGDSALLEKILSTPQKEKTKIIPIVYKAASLAAAFILIATVALSPVIKDKFATTENATTETEESAEIIAEENVTEETAGVLSDSANEETATFSLRTEDGKKLAENTNEKAENTETTTASEAVVINETYDVAAYSPEYNETEAAYDGSANGIALTSETEVQAIAEEVTKTEITASGGGGGAPAVTKSAKPRVKAYTANDVLAHIGINYESLALDDMVLTEDNVSAEFSEDGTISYYYIEMSLSDGDKHIKIILTDSVTPLAYDISEAEGGVIASKTYENTDIFITAQNMGKDEVESYLNKIA